MKLTFHGATREVTGSMHLLEVNNRRILLECGLYQGRRADTYERNLNFPFDPASIDALVLSAEDLEGDLAPLREYTRLCRIVVLTTGWQGATVFLDGERHEAPPRLCREVDPTGAGDVFTAAFLIRLEETSDPLQAAWFANVVASFSVEQSGTKGIPTRAEVEAWLQANG